MSTICIVVDADVIRFATSEQFTTVPFKPMLTESIDNVEMKGRGGYRGGAWGAQAPPLQPRQHTGFYRHS